MTQTTVIHSTQPQVPVSSTQTQSARQASTVDSSTRAAVLPRLSGLSRQGAVFDSARIPSDASISKVADGLARKPLNGLAMEKAKTAEKLIEDLDTRSLTGKTLREFEALRADALKDNPSPDVRAYFDSLARVLLLRPLTSALGNISPQDAASIADTLHELLSNILTADSVQQMESCQKNLDGLRHILAKHGLLNAAQKDGLIRLDSLIGYRAATCVKLDLLDRQIRQLEQGKEGDQPLSQIRGSLQELQSKTAARSRPDAPPLGDMALERMGGRMTSLNDRLYALSELHAAELQDEVSGLLNRIRQEGGEDKPLEDGLVQFGARLEAAKDKLLPDQALVLQDGLDRLKGALTVRKGVSDAAQALKDTPNNAKALEAKKAELEECVTDLKLHDEDRTRLAESLKALDRRINDVRGDAAIVIHDFIAKAEDQVGKVSGEELRQLQVQIDDRMQSLQDTPPVNLAEDFRQEAIRKLEALGQQCRVSQSETMRAASQSPCRQAISVKACALRLEELGLDAARLDEQKAFLAASSNGDLTALQRRISDLGETVEGRDADQLWKIQNEMVKLDKLAERRLLPADRPRFNDALKGLADRVEQGLFKTLVEDRRAAGSPFAELGEQQIQTMQTLCKKAGYHPSLMKELENMAARGTKLPQLLDALAPITPPLTADSKVLQSLDSLRIIPPLTADSKVLQSLDSLFLSHPELDDSALAIKQGLVVEEAQKKRVEYMHDSSRAKREVGLLLEELLPKSVRDKLGIKTEVTTETLEKVVQEAGKDNKKKLQRMDLSLIRALWTAKKTDNPALTFANFQDTLPEVYKSMKDLEQYINQGISGRQMLNDVSTRMGRVSRGFGNRTAMRELIERAVAGSDDKWAAGKALTSLVHKLGINALSGEQGMEDLEAVASALERKTGLKFQDIVAQGNIAQLKATLNELEKDAAQLDLLRRELLKDPVRDGMRKRLEGVLTNEQLDKITRGENLKGKLGATFSTGVLLLKGILDQRFLPWEQRQELIRNLNFQDHVQIGNMKGNTWDKSDKAGRVFKQTLRALQDAANGEQFQQASKVMQALMDHPSVMDDAGVQTKQDALRKFWSSNGQHKLGYEAALSDFHTAVHHAVSTAKQQGTSEVGMDQKAEAILFFKTFKTMSATDSLESKLKRVTKRQFRKCPGAAVAKGFVLEHVAQVGVAARQAESTSRVQTAELAKLEERDKVQKAHITAYNKGYAQVLRDMAQMVVCKRFLASDKSSAADIVAECELHRGQMEEWNFYKECLHDLTIMGYNQDVASVFLRETLTGLNQASFVKFAGHVGSDRGLNLDRYGAEGLSKTDRRRMAEFDTNLYLARQAISQVADPDQPKVMTLAKTTSAGVKIPVFESPAASVGVEIRGGLENGMTIWKDQRDGKFHMALVRTGSGGAGVEAEVGFAEIADTVEAKATVGVEVHARVGRGCELVFDDQEKCEQVMAAIISGQADKSLLGFCSSVHTLNSVGVGGRIELGVEVGIKAKGASLSSPGPDPIVSTTEEDEEDAESLLSLGVGVSLSGDLSWETKVNSRELEKTRIKQGAVTATASYAVLPGVMEDLQAATTNVAAQKSLLGQDELGQGIRQMREDVSSVFQGEGSLTLGYEEHSKVVTDPHNITLKGMERTCVFESHDLRDAVVALRSQGLSDEFIRHVVAAIGPDGDGFRLEVTRSLNPATVAQCNANREHKIHDRDFTPDNVRLVMDDRAAKRAVGVSFKVFSFEASQQVGTQVTLDFDPTLFLPRSSQAALGRTG